MENNIVELNVDMVRSAFEVIKKESLRYVLSCVLIRTDGSIRATTGKILFQGENVIILNGKLERDILLPVFKIKSNVVRLSLEFPKATIEGTSCKVTANLFEKNGALTSLNLGLLDGTYQSLKNFEYSSVDCHFSNRNDFGVNPDYLLLIKKVFPKSNGVRIRNYNRSGDDTDAGCYLVESIDDRIKENAEDYSVIEPWKLFVMPIVISE